MRRLLSSPFLWVAVIVVATAASALTPIHRPRLPGILHVAVIAGESPTDLDRALRPLADLLGRSLRRSATFRSVDGAVLLAENPEFDVALVPARFAEDNARLRVLAWAKPIGCMSWRSRLLAVRRKGAERPERVAVGDSLLWGGERDWRRSLPERYQTEDASLTFAGPSPYSHREVLVGLGQGQFDAAIVHSADLRRAFEAGWVDQSSVEVELLEADRPWMALVAAPTLSEPAFDELREAALSLDHYRFDPTNGPAGAVIASLAQVGIAGFSPIEPFPGLRP